MLNDSGNGLPASAPDPIGRFESAWHGIRDDVAQSLTVQTSGIHRILGEGDRLSPFQVHELRSGNEHSANLLLGASFRPQLRRIHDVPYESFSHPRGSAAG